ncbi:MAG: hypothetical protein CVV13_13325 [Gammaproteobacteria bacterium HGW-Gammaproteobacteria-3]|nr:MAG: hypothetical protein CVV13_13325 [Gammaproteobacteria bacterium HGW-Gammaproteobacteria-3]
MSFFDPFFKKSRLDKAIKEAAKARKREGAEAEHLFKTAYAGFAEVIANDLLFSETLYNWGFALLHEAKTKSGEEAAALYEDAIAKFAFCSTVNPASLGAAIDGGVAYMDLARNKGVAPTDTLYEKAKQQFERADAIQKGTASYNLACIFALRNDEDACLSALEDSKSSGSLPSEDDILNDSDLDGVKHHHWFMDFMASLTDAKENTDEAATSVPHEPESTVAATEPDVATESKPLAADETKIASAPAAETVVETKPEAPGSQS